MSCETLSPALSRPTGEGESFAASTNVVSRHLQNALAQIGTRPMAVPSPRGQGQGEDELQTIF